jgi:hypothetical protein
MLKILTLTISDEDRAACDLGCRWLDSDCDGFHCSLFCEKLGAIGMQAWTKPERCALCEALDDREGVDHAYPMV